jgi:DNA-directed RNA polymerase subunit M/transcription elongation factor TFIIS
MAEPVNNLFCKDTLNLLEEITTGDVLMLKSNKTGNVYPADAESTKLAGEDTAEMQSYSKYQKTLTVTAYDPTNPRAEIPNGCDHCGRKIVSYQRLGEGKKVYYVCICGNNWHN